MKCNGGRGLGTNFQLLMLSPYLLKSQIPFMVWGLGGGVLGTNFQLLVLGPNLLKSQIPFTIGWGGGGGNQLPAFEAELKSAKVPNSLYGGGGGWVLGTNFQLLILSKNLLKSKHFYTA